MASVRRFVVQCLIVPVVAWPMIGMFVHAPKSGYLASAADLYWNIAICCFTGGLIGVIFAAISEKWDATGRLVGIPGLLLLALDLRSALGQESPYLYLAEGYAPDSGNEGLGFYLVIAPALTLVGYSAARVVYSRWVRKKTT